MIPRATGRARAEAARIHALFLTAGADPVETAILQPADVLLDLYGEDIRARAYTTHDPLRGEMMLRPDFTVPVAEAHMASGADPAAYAYWDGANWTDGIGQAAPIVPAPAGELSVAWSEAHGHWLMMYFEPERAEIVLRTRADNQAVLPMVMAAGMRGRIRMAQDTLTVRVPVRDLKPLGR